MRAIVANATRMSTKICKEETINVRQFGKALVLCGLALLLVASSLRAQSLSISSAKNAADSDLRVNFSESGLKNQVGDTIGYRIAGEASCAAGRGEVGTEFSLTVGNSGHTRAIVPVEEPVVCEGTGTSVVYSSMRLCDTTNRVCQAF
jgi:hypothetical protein